MSDLQILEQINATQRQLKEIYIPERTPRIIATFQSLPGLVGLWYAGNFQRSTGNVYDFSGQTRTLTYNGNPKFANRNNGTGYNTLDGTGDYFSRADETDLDVQGNESVVNSSAAWQGMTVLGWIYPGAVGGASGSGIVSKDYTAGNNRSWHIIQGAAASTLFGRITTDGSTLVSLSMGDAGTGAWAFIAFRFIPSTSLDGWINNSKTTNAVGIPATIFNGNAAFQIGAYGAAGTFLFTGSWSIFSYHSMALNDGTIQSVYQQTRLLYQ